MHQDGAELLLGGGQLVLLCDPSLVLGDGGRAWTRIRWKNLFLGASVEACGWGGPLRSLGGVASERGCLVVVL